MYRPLKATKSLDLPDVKTEHHQNNGFFSRLKSFSGKKFGVRFSSLEEKEIIVDKKCLDCVQNEEISYDFCILADNCNDLVRFYKKKIYFFPDYKHSLSSI